MYSSSLTTNRIIYYFFRTITIIQIMYQQNYIFDSHPPKEIKKNSNMAWTVTESDINKQLLLLNSVNVIRPIPTAPPKSADSNHSTNHKQRSSSSYWRKNFILVSIPFLFWGLPTHLLFGRRRITSTREWLKALCPCKSPCTTLLTLITVALSAILNITCVYNIGNFIYLLLVVAEITPVLINAGIDLIRVLPVVLPMNLLWVKGYALRNFIATFDHVTQTVSCMDGENLPAVIPGCRLKLALLYLTIGVIHTLHFIVEYFSPDKDIWETSIANQIQFYALNYPLSILFTCMFPAYCTFVWGIHYHLLILKAYIKTLIRGRAVPKYLHFDQFKISYRRVADDIMRVNKIFSVYLSFVIIVLGFYIYTEGQNLGMTILVSFFKKKNPEDPNSIPELLTPERVRIIVANITIILLYLALFCQGIWSAVKVNDEVRYLHVWLNDFVSEPESRLRAELYEGFQCLKYYIHSRLEQQRPAFLTIALVGLIPVLRSRLLLYDVRH